MNENPTTNNSVELKNRIITSILLLLFTVPFIVLSGLKGHGFHNVGYDYFFVSYLILIYVYITYEISSAISESAETFWSMFLSSIFIFGPIFGYILITMMMNGFLTDQSAITANETIFSQREITIIVSALIVGTITYFIANSVIPSDWSYAFTTYVVMMVTGAFLITATIVLFKMSILWLMLLSVIVATTDIMAYFAGNRWGQTKAFPHISPNKTAEGLSIGITSGIIMGFVWYYALIYTINPFGLYETMEIGIIIATIFVSAISAPLGDLMFSKIKRSFDIKDFSDILPGHGGLLDRIDSHLVGVTLGATILIMFQLL